MKTKIQIIHETLRNIKIRNRTWGDDASYYDGYVDALKWVLRPSKEY